MNRPDDAYLITLTERTQSYIRWLESENARLREAFARHARGEIRTSYGWTGSRMAWWGRNNTRNFSQVGPYDTPIEAVLAVMKGSLDKALED